MGVNWIKNALYQFFESACLSIINILTLFPYEPPFGEDRGPSYEPVLSPMDILEIVFWINV